MNESLSKAELSQLAQFKLLMRKVHQHSVDLSLFVSDASYAKETLDLAEDTDHEDLMMLAIELRAQLGLLSAAAEPVIEVQPIVTALTAIAETPPIEDKPRERYKGSLR